MAISLWASISMGSMQVDLQAEGAGYSPDLVNDLLTQLHKTFESTLGTARDMSLLIGEENLLESDDD